MNVNLELLRTFAVASASPTFGEAARKRHVTVSAISQQIAALERQLGVKLFERVGRGVRPTSDGTRLAAAIADGLMRIDESIAELVGAHQAVRGRVAIGAPRPFAAFWLRPRLPELLAAYPALELQVRFDVPSALERALEDGALDLTILARQSERPAIDHRAIHTETFVLVGAPTYFAKRARPRAHAELGEHPFVVFDEDLPMHRAFFRATFGARATLPSRIACTIASLDEMLALIESGAALGVLPDYFVERAVAAGRVEVLDLGRGAKRQARNTLYLAWRRSAVDSARLRAVREALSTVERSSRRT